MKQQSALTTQAMKMKETRGLEGVNSENKGQQNGG